jgi:hypothetical protein
MQHVGGMDGLHAAQQLQQDAFDYSRRQWPAVCAQSSGEVGGAELKRQHHTRAVR